MKININGVTRDMTAEEETEILVNTEGTDGEIEALEQKLSDNLRLRADIDYLAIMSGVEI